MAALSPPAPPFRILSLDGGGIRGLFIARFLANLEAQLAQDGNPAPALYQHFDLICGTSTGGIIALALALGMPARDLVHLYSHHAKDIFGAGRSFISRLGTAQYPNQKLELLLKERFQPYSPNGDTRLGHAKTRVCIPVFNAASGKVNIYKTCHHPSLTSDYQMPAFQVAMSTAAAPLYFNPYSPTYLLKETQETVTITHNIDGGIFANNPALIGLAEAHRALNLPLADIRILSIGTGTKTYMEQPKQRRWGLLHWIGNKEIRLLDMILHAQADFIDNTCQVLSQGVDGEAPHHFFYDRVQFEFRNKAEYVNLDATDPAKLHSLQERADNLFKLRGRKVAHDFCATPVKPFMPCVILQ